MYFQNHGRCKENEWLVIGHRLTPDDIRTCYEEMDEWDEALSVDESNNLFFVETRYQRRGLTEPLSWKEHPDAQLLSTS